MAVSSVQEFFQSADVKLIQPLVTVNGFDPDVIFFEGQPVYVPVGEGTRVSTAARSWRVTFEGKKVAIYFKHEG